MNGTSDEHGRHQAALTLQIRSSILPMDTATTSIDLLRSTLQYGRDKLDAGEPSIEWALTDPRTELREDSKQPEAEYIPHPQMSLEVPHVTLMQALGAPPNSHPIPCGLWHSSSGLVSRHWAVSNIALDDGITYLSRSTRSPAALPRYAVFGVLKDLMSTASGPDG
jgi:hypothetical protein